MSRVQQALCPVLHFMKITCLLNSTVNMYGDYKGMVAKFLKTELKPDCELLDNGYLN